MLQKKTVINSQFQALISRRIQFKLFHFAGKYTEIYFLILLISPAILCSRNFFCFVLEKQFYRRNFSVSPFINLLDVCVCVYTLQYHCLLLRIWKWKLSSNLSVVINFYSVLFGYLKFTATINFTLTNTFSQAEYGDFSDFKINLCVWQT